MNSSLIPRVFIDSLNALLLYCEPLSQRRVRLSMSTRGCEARALFTDIIAFSFTAEVSKAYPNHSLWKTSSALKRKHHPSTPHHSKVISVSHSSCGFVAFASLEDERIMSLFFFEGSIQLRWWNILLTLFLLIGTWSSRWSIAAILLVPNVGLSSAISFTFSTT